MKKYILLIFVLSLFIIVGCQQNDRGHDSEGQLSTALVEIDKTAGQSNNEGMPVITFQKEEHDFGQVIDGEKLTYSFKFENTGDKPLIISNAKGSCGCTVPEWPREPIKSGGKGEIVVTFNSSGRSGLQNKAVTLTTNANPSNKVIRIKSEVITN